MRPAYGCVVLLGCCLPLLSSACSGSTAGEHSDAGALDAFARDGARPDGSSGVVDGGEPDAAALPCGDGVCADDEDATACCADCGVCTEGAVVRIETGTAAGAPGGALTAGGMADTHASFSGGPFTELVFPFTVIDEPVEGSSYFWAQQFFFEGTTQGGYTGVQTNGILGGSVVGKMLIFSIWEALGATPGPTASCEPFGGEGIGYSCRLVFAWRENVTYRMILREAATDEWSVSVGDPTVPGEILLGTIRVLPGWGRIRPSTAGFAEYYGQVASCEALPHAVALLHQPVADGALAPSSVDAGVYGTCAAYATSVCTGALCR
jgi:hypothetical protein